MKINEKNLAGFAVSDSPIDKEGWLLKRGEVNKSFQRRWFTLKGNLLFYSEKKTDKEPSGVIILEGCTIELAEYEEQYAFKIVFHGAGDRTYVLGADSQETMEAWMKALACASYDYMKLMVSELQRQLDEMIELEKAHVSIFDDQKVCPIPKTIAVKVQKSAPPGSAARATDTPPEGSPQAPSRLRRGHSQPKQAGNSSSQRINPFDRDSSSKQQPLSSSAPGTPVSVRHANATQASSFNSHDARRPEHNVLLKNETSSPFASKLCRPFFDLHELYGATIRRDVESWNKKLASGGATGNLIDLKTN